MSSSLFNLLEKLQESDNGAPLDDKDFAILNEDLKNKIDSIYDFYSRCEAEIERLDKDFIKPIQARKKAIQNSMDNLEKWIINTMAIDDLPLLHGNLMTLKLQEKESVQFDDIDIDQTFYLSNKEIVERKYSLSKKSISENIKNGISYPFARIVKNKFIRFTVRKEGKKK